MTVEAGFTYSPEVTRPYPLTVRGHHAYNIAKTVVGYSTADLQAVDVKGKVIPLSELYAYPVEGKHFIQKLAANQVDRLLERYADGLGFRFLNDEYFGMDGIRARRFQAHKAAFYEQIFLSPPETTIEVNTLPDAICRGCQSAPGDIPARHCMSVEREDAVIVRILGRLTNSELLEDGHHASFFTPLSVLRDVVWMREFLEAYEENTPIAKSIRDLLSK